MILYSLQVFQTLSWVHCGMPSVLWGHHIISYHFMYHIIYHIISFLTSIYTISACHVKSCVVVVTIGFCVPFLSIHLYYGGLEWWLCLRASRGNEGIVHQWFMFDTFLWLVSLFFFCVYCLFLFVYVLDLFYYLWIIWYDYCCFRCRLLWWTCRFDTKYQNNHLIGSRTISFQDALWSIMVFHCFMVNDRCNRLYGYSQTSVVTWWFRHIMFSAIGTSGNITWNRMVVCYQHPKRTGNFTFGEVCASSFLKKNTHDCPSSMGKDRFWEMTGC